MPVTSNSNLASGNPQTQIIPETDPVTTTSSKMVDVVTFRIP